MLASPGYPQVAETFSALIRQSPPGSAAQLAVIHSGELVVDLVAGGGLNMPIGGDTPFLTFSVSKVFTACAVHRLVEDGRVDLDEPIAKYWPEFGCRGKETATIRHALLHQAGVPAPHLNRQVLTWPSWRLVTAGLAREKAVFPPGSQTAYHLVNFGFILGEVVHRVTGDPVDIYLQKSFFEPMGLKNTWMRIPAQALNRSPKLVSPTPVYRTNVRLFNLPVIRRALIPAACLHTTARELAAFFQMLLDCGEYKGRRYLQARTVAQAARSYYDGYDSYIRYPMNWGLGFIMGGGEHQPEDRRQSAYGWGSSEATFGGLGMGTCMAWADRRSGIVCAFTTNVMLPDPQVSERWAEISNSVWDSVLVGNTSIQ